MDTGDRRKRLVFIARGQDVRLDQDEGAARIQNGPNGFPLTFTSASGGPSGKVWCTMQPASQVRVGGGLAAPLAWAHRGMPSGGASLLAHPRGNGGALSPASLCLGRIRQFYGPHELERRVGFSCRPPVDGAGKSPEETVDDHALRYLGGREGSVQQPVMREPA